jgi:hypothetical protein
MATYRIKAPDGSTYQVNAPDTATEADVLAYARANFSKSKAASTPKPYDPTEDMSTFERVAAGAGKSIYDTGRGIGQLFGLVSQADIDESARLDKALMNTTAGTVGNIGGQVAQMALPGGIAARGAQAIGIGGAKLLPTLARAATGSSLYAGTQPVLTGESRIGNMGVAGLAGGAGQGVASGVGALARPAKAALSPVVSQLAAKAEAMGIPVNAAQLSDSKFIKTLSSTLERLPFTGATQSRNAQQQAFNQAVSRTFGENTPSVTQDVYAAAKKRIGGEFNRLSEQNNLVFDDTLLTRLIGIQDEATKFGSNESARAVASAIDELFSKSANGLVPGRAYQSLDSKLGKLMKTGDEKAMFLGQVRDTVRSAMDDSISAVDKEAWQTARGQYKALKTIRDLVAKDGSGDVSAAGLTGRMNSSQAGKEAMAMGKGGDLADLARIGKQFVRDPIPDSGTAGRMSAMQMLTGAGALTGGGYAFGIDPSTTLALLAGGATGGRALNSAMNSKAARNYMLKGSNLLELVEKGLLPLPYATTALALDSGR